jgi:YVTN family beta-propeller protein
MHFPIPVKLVMVLSVLLFGLHTVSAQGYLSNHLPEKEKVYVALEGEGKVAVLDAAKQKVISRISLRERQGREMVEYMAHNVQVAPDGSKVWVTANAMTKEAHSEMNAGHGEKMMEAQAKQDQLIVIDPKKDRIIKRISLGSELHLSHVVVSAEGDYAYALSQEKGLLYKIDTATYEVKNRIDLGAMSGPHGLRLSPDGTKAFVALMMGKGLAVVDTATGAVEKVDLPGAAVQTAVTPDGKTVAVSLFDTKQVALYRPETKQLSFINLPTEAKGPVQLYPTPDSKYVYVADQGYYFDQPTSEWVYKIDLSQGNVVQTIKVGKAPHGVVVSSDRRHAYVTNLLSNDVSVIDLQIGKEMKRIKVGETPNGISIWSIKSIGTP